MTALLMRIGLGNGHCRRHRFYDRAVSIEDPGQDRKSAQSEDPPVSVKAALRVGDQWVLLRNDRHEWELPGGRVDAGDRSLQDVVRRECREELGLDVEIGPLVAAYLFEAVRGKRVTIVCYAASYEGDDEIVVSDEHRGYMLTGLEDLGTFPLATGYRKAILAAAEILPPETLRGNGSSGVAGLDDEDER